MKFTKITMYHQTPLTDVNNTIHFKSNEERDRFFDTHYEQKTTPKEYNFLRQDLTVRIDTRPNTGVDWAWLQGVNYIRFESDFEPTEKVYCFVAHADYNNNGTTTLYLIVDGIMTYLQGDFVYSLKNVNINRQHLTAEKFANYLPYLRTNTDVINVGQRYISNIKMGYYFNKFMVIIQSAVSLTEGGNSLEDRFGSEDDPRIKGASGGKYDKVVGAMDLYAVEYDEFHQFMKAFKNFPWITDNFASVLVVPKSIVSLTPDNATKQTFTSDDGAFSFYELQSSKGNKLNNTDDRITVDTATLYDIFSIDQNHPELMREEYASIHVTGYNGQELTLNPALLKDEKLQIKSDASVGYQNQVAFYPYQYGMLPGSGGDSYKDGSYMDNAIIFKDFDTTGVVIDNGKLSIAKSANQRRVSNEKTLLGSLNPQHANAGERFMIQAGQVSRWVGGAVNGARSGGYLGAGASVAGMVSDDFWHYREQNAQIQDARIQAPSVTAQSGNNNFNIKHDIFGITVKYEVLPFYVMNMVKNYHNRFGFQMDFITDVSSIESMSRLNYLRCTGAYAIDPSRNIPQNIFKQIQAQLESGVSFWHNPENVDNPFVMDISDNESVM